MNKFNTDDQLAFVVLPHDNPVQSFEHTFTDAHSVADQGNMPYGVGTAQRGWLTPDDVINTWPLDRLRAFLRKGR